MSDFDERPSLVELLLDRQYHVGGALFSCPKCGELNTIRRSLLFSSNVNNPWSGKRICLPCYSDYCVEQDLAKKVENE